MYRTLGVIQTTALVALLIGSSAMNAVAEESKKPPVPTPDCSSAKHQRLRMLLGSWIVTEDGKEVGRNTLQPGLWGLRGARGLESHKSLNRYQFDFL